MCRGNGFVIPRAIVGLLLSSFCLALAEDHLPPPPWVWGRLNDDEPIAGRAPDDQYKGRPSLFLRVAFVPRNTTLFPYAAGLQQEIKADRYRGRRMRWSAEIKTEAVSNYWETDAANDYWRNDPIVTLDLRDLQRRQFLERISHNLSMREDSAGAGLYVFIDSADRVLLYAETGDGRNGTESRPRFTTDWTRVEMVFDVPPESVGISLGFFMAGVGKMWTSDFQFEDVGASVKTTLPRNLDLTETQIYDDTLARHQVRVLRYMKSPEAPTLITQ